MQCVLSFGALRGSYAVCTSSCFRPRAEIQHVLQYHSGPQHGAFFKTDTPKSNRKLSLEPLVGKYPQRPWVGLMLSSIPGLEGRSHRVGPDQRQPGHQPGFGEFQKLGRAAVYSGFRSSFVPARDTRRFAVCGISAAWHGRMSGKGASFLAGLLWTLSLKAHWSGLQTSSTEGIPLPLVASWNYSRWSGMAFQSVLQVQHARPEVFQVTQQASCRLLQPGGV